VSQHDEIVSITVMLVLQYLFYIKFNSDVTTQ